MQTALDATSGTYDPPSELIERARRDLQLAWSRLRASLEERIVVIEACVVAILNRTADELGRRSAAGSANELATMFGRLGIASGADVARTLSGDLARSSRDAAALAGLVQELRSALSTADHDAASVALVGTPVLIVGEPGELLDRLVWSAPAAGVIAFQTPTSMASAHGAGRVDASVVVIDEGALSSSRAVLRSVKDSTRGAPIVVASVDRSLAHRLPVADLVEEVVSTRVPPDQIIRAARSAVARCEPAPVRIVGDDPTRLSVLLSRLPKLVRNCTELDPGADVLDVIRTTPHVLVVDRQVGGVPGHHYVAALRTDAAGRRSSIVWLAGEADQIEIEAAEMAGVDALLPCDAPSEVIAETIARLQTRLAQTRLEGDLDGGVSPWHNGRPLLERTLQRARRQGWLVALALIDLDRDALAESGLVPHQAAARVASRLEGEFRAGDVITWFGPLQFVVALQQAGQRIGIGRLERLVSSLGLPSGAVRVVVSEFPSDGPYLAGLLDDAQKTLESTKVEGGPVVVSAGWQDNIASTADVVIVDSDPGVVSLLTHTLEGQGYRVCSYTDGLAAARHLSGSTGDPLPRLVIFDLYLNGISGLELVRRLDRAGTLKRFKSVLLTAQPDEGDVLEALDLGVDDYMPKPFSTSMLRHRVRRALEER